MPKPGPVKYGNATQRVLEYLRDHSDMLVPYGEMVRELKMPATTISNSVGYLVHNLNVPVEKPMRGVVLLRSIKTLPVPAPAKLDNGLYEFVGDIGERGILLKGEDGTLWAATPLEKVLRGLVE